MTYTKEQIEQAEAALANAEADLVAANHHLESCADAQNEAWDEYKTASQKRSDAFDDWRNALNLMHLAKVKLIKMKKGGDA